MDKNNQVPVTRQWLESLSTGELIKLADSYGIDIPPGLERIFIIEELLESANVEEQKFEEIEINPSYSESVALPKQYNISFIEVVIRDPLWVFAFWEIKGHDREAHENAGDFNGYFLRVIPLNELEPESKSREDSFTVSINADDCARYLGFADFADRSSPESGRYVIKLGALRGDSELELASSAPFGMPSLIEDENIAGMIENPLIRLSGAQDLAIIKKEDRQPRVKRQ